MKKLLMISYFYPPLNNVGGLRTLAFSKYLQEFGWKPFVLSVRNPDRIMCSYGNNEPPDRVEVYYTRSIFNLTWITGKLNGLLYKLLSIFGIELKRSLVFDLFCIPDQFIGWIPLTLIKAISVIKNNDIDLIYVSCKPFSSAIIGVILKILTGKKLILDFRDPTTPLMMRDYEYWKKLPKFYITKWTEKFCLKYTDLFIVVTHETKDLYLYYFPFLKDRIYVIYNGFMEDFFDIDVRDSRSFMITYIGDFYQNYVSPEPFFKGMHSVFSQRKDLADKIKFLYVGNIEKWILRMTDKYELSDNVILTGHVSRSEAIKYLMRSSILLLRIVPGMISTKLFEGLACGIPLLATIEKGETEELIRRYSSAEFYIVRPEDDKGISNAVIDSYMKWSTGSLPKAINRSFYKDFSKKNLTRKFSHLLDQLAE